MESLRERKKAATRTAIADTAMQLFERFGYDQVSVERVAREAGVSKQTVFNYFPTKELLVFDRADEVREAMVSAVRDRPPGVSVVESFRRLTREFWGRFAALPDERPQRGFFHVVAETPSLGAYQRELGAAIVADVAAVLRAEAGRGSRRSPPGGHRCGTRRRARVRVRRGAAPRRRRRVAPGLPRRRAGRGGPRLRPAGAGNRRLAVTAQAASPAGTASGEGASSAAVAANAK